MAKEYNQLQADEKIDKDSTIFQLNPFICKEDAVIKMKSRLSNFELLPEQTKFPKIIAKDSRMGDLLILDAHTNNAHAGPQFTHRILRNNYWIIGGKTKHLP